MASVRGKEKNKVVNKALEGAKRSMFTGMGFFVQIQPHVKKMEDSTAELEQTVAMLGNVLTKYLDLEELPEPQAVPVVNRESTIQDTTAKVKKRAFDLAKLGLVIPFLLNKDSREYLSSFISGLTGINFDVIKNTLIAVGGVLTGIFAYRLFKQISDTITAVGQLSNLTATLFGITSTAVNEVGAEKDNLDKEKEKRRNKRKAKIERTKKLRKAIKGASTLAKISLIGAAVGIIVDAAINSVLDYNDQEDAILDSDEEEGKAPDPENVWTLITKNIIESLTFGLLSKDSLSNTLKVFKGDEKVVAQNREAVSGMSVSGAEFGGFEPVFSEVPSPSPAVATPVIKPAPVEAITTGNIGPTQSTGIMNKEEKVEQDLEIPQFTLPSTLSIAEASEQVVLERKQASQLVVVNNIDNSTVVVTEDQKLLDRSTNYNYSTAVGM